MRTLVTQSPTCFTQLGEKVNSDIIYDLNITMNKLVERETFIDSIRVKSPKLKIFAQGFL